MLATWSRLIPNYCNKEANAVLCTQGGTCRMSLPLAGFSTALPILARLTRYAAKGNGAMRGGRISPECGGCARLPLRDLSMLCDVFVFCCLVAL